MSAELTPARTAILANRFETIARQMSYTLLRTARSGVLNTARDFSCAILSRRNELLFFAESLPVHVCGLSLEAAEMAAVHGHDLRRGDAYLNNSPYHGGTHHADHTILVPVFAGGEWMFTVCAKAHQADCGNARATTYSPRAQDLYEEGALSFPCVRVQRDHTDEADVIRMCRSRIRVPDQWYGDYLSAVGAARVGERKLEDLTARYGQALVERFVAGWLDYSEARMVEEIAGLPAGTFEGESTHDPFPGIPDGLTIRARVSIDPSEPRIAVDLTDNPDCVPCGLNLSEATASAAAAIGVFGSLDPGVPLNQGSLRRLGFRLRENCVVGRPRHPASCSVATTNVADRVVNAVARAMAVARPEYSQAEGGLGIPASRAVIWGTDPRHRDRPFVNQIFLGPSGGPATSTSDGWLTTTTPISGGLSYRDSVEIDEQKYPLLVRRLELAPDSGGAGTHRGAPGTVVEYGPIPGATFRVTYASEGREHPARGAFGGGDGGRSDVERIGVDGREERLPQVGEVELASGEALRATSCGGGGWGDPAQREPALLEHDIAEGIVTGPHHRLD